MPNYKFECTKCNSTKDVYSRIADRDIERECTKCKIPMVRLISSGGGFYLKGEGFYKKGWSK